MSQTGVDALTKSANLLFGWIVAGYQYRKRCQMVQLCIALA